MRVSQKRNKNKTKRQANVQDDFICPRKEANKKLDKKRGRPDLLPLKQVAFGFQFPMHYD